MTVPDALDALDANLERTRCILDDADPPPHIAEVVGDILSLIGPLHHLIRRYYDISNAVDF